MYIKPSCRARFCSNGENSVISAAGSDLFFDSNARLLRTVETPVRDDFLAISDAYAAAGSMDSVTLRILDYESYKSADLVDYDADYYHDEARYSPKYGTVMLFSYRGFRLLDSQGNIIAEIVIPDAKENIYDTQYRRTEQGDYLEVFYNDGTVQEYSAEDGTLLSERQEGLPDSSLQETFVTNDYVIVAPLHGCAEVYDRTGKNLLKYLTEDAYLTYITQMDSYLVAQYQRADGTCYGQLMNENCEVLAELPYLCDVLEGQLLFDYPAGTVRRSFVYDIDRLIQKAKEEV